MRKLGIFLGLITVMTAFEAVAEIDVMSAMDRAARASASKSIMFKRNNNPEAERVQREQAEAKAEQKAPAAPSRPAFRPYNLFGTGYKIAATINGEMVSNKDLQERANLFALTTGIQINNKNRNMVADKVLQNTVDEKVKIQEAAKQNIHVTDDEIKEAYRNFERSNGIPAGKFQSVLRQYQISPKVFMTQIKANLLWNKLVGRRLGQNVDVSVKEIEDEYAHIRKDMDTPKYMVSEIVIKRKDAEHIDELVEILRNDKRFELYAAQFSQSASAPSGGKLGWVAPGQLAAPLDKVIRNLKVGQVSNAIPYRSDYYIFKMDKIYNPLKDKREMPDEEEVRNFIKGRKMDEMANKYIRDLRNRAVVEKKF